MNAKEMNEIALDHLMKQNWQMAQHFLFKNARKHPSHETYNNLGNFLIHEGIICKNGKIRSAQKLGMKYLLRALEMKSTSTNLCSIAKAYDFALRSVTDMSKESLVQKMYHLLTVAYSITASSETLYNILRLKILTKVHNETIIEDIKMLLTEFTCEESVRLYFEMLRFYSLYDEGLCCIAQYGEYLSEVDLLLFYAKYKKYNEGYCLCDTVCNQYSPDKYTSAAIIECCVNTNHLEEARLYAKHITEIEDTISCTKKDNWYRLVFTNLNTSEKSRCDLIAEYLSIPPFVDTCCYFGCPIHKTSTGDSFA